MCSIVRKWQVRSAAPSSMHWQDFFLLHVIPVQLKKHDPLYSMWMHVISVRTCAARVIDRLNVHGFERWNLSSGLRPTYPLGCMSNYRISRRQIAALCDCDVAAETRNQCGTPHIRRTDFPRHTLLITGLGFGRSGCVLEACVYVPPFVEQILFV